MKHKYLTSSPSQTKQIGKILAQEVIKKPFQKQAFIIGLEGDLGGGKTTFLQGFAKGLGIKQKILSPTFVIMKRFRINHRFFKTFYHIDCYRIQTPKEILYLGFKDITSNPRNIIVIEWADRIQEILPKDTIILKFEFIDKNKRRISILNFDESGRIN